MTRRLIPVMLAGLVALAGFALAQDPPAGQDEPPVRLKKKKPRGDEKPAAKPEEKKKDNKKEDKKSEKNKEEPREAEPVTPQEEEKEVLQRVVKNVHDVGERLAKNDLGEGTRQTQRDILKDIESLINRNENPPQSNDQDQGGGGGGDDQNPMDNQGGGGGQKSQSKQGGGGQKSQSGAGGGGQKRQGQAGNSGGGQKSQGNRGGGNASTQPGGEKPSGQKPGDRSAGGEKPGGRNGKNGKGGGGGDKGERAMNKNADLYKDVWGHLPETLRAQMDAYSNPQPFLPKYDELIKRYYRTIAEQGRRKGE